MSLPTPSREQIQKPGSEGRCPPEKVDGDNPSYSASITIGNHVLKIDHSGGSKSDPAPAMPGA